MKSAPSATALAATLLLHLALIAAATIGWSDHRDKPAELPPMTVQLIQAQPAAAPVPQPVAPPPPEKKQLKPKPVALPAKPAIRATPEPKAPEAPSEPRPSPPVATAPAAPAAPAKTSVYISASYAASNRKPAYPSLSRQYGDQGTVVLRVLVKADGSAGAVDLKSPSGFPLLDESARSAVLTWRFNPATSDGKPIAEWFLVPIPFKLQN